MILALSPHFYCIKLCDPIGKYSNLTVSLFTARKFLVVLEQCGVALSTNMIHLPNFSVSVLDNQQMYHC